MSSKKVRFFVRANENDPYEEGWDQESREAIPNEGTFWDTRGESYFADKVAHYPRAEVYTSEVWLTKVDPMAKYGVLTR